MKAIKTSLIGVLIVFCCVSANANKDGDEESIQSVSAKLEKAIGMRKFADAKELISVLMPLMKKDIKESKKTLAHIQKGLETGMDLKDYSQKLNRKNELYESTKGLIESSPAAIRVKGKDLVNMVNEYAGLVEIKENKS